MPKLTPRIVNPIFFIRGVEPRGPEDLVEPVVNAIKLMSEHDLPATFLLQYDAFIDDRFLGLIKGLGSCHEIGVWLEMVQPLVEKAGAKWRGRWSWDYESHIGMLMGYTPSEREKIIDVYFKDFKNVFGYYPKSVGSWVLDAHTLGYLSDKYGVVAACNCKDQCGTDGMTLWGGYWNQAYFPSRSNALMPAQDEDHQIPIPVFRMLGSDPIYQYDHGVDQAQQGVVILEPVYTDGGGGGDDKWVDWFFETNFKTPCLAFAYAQAGQENSFGWPGMKHGLGYQFKELKRLQQESVVRIETLADSGAWFKENFELTPVTAVTALTDWQGAGHKSVWYNSRFYRTNLFWENNQLRIRDIHMFDQRYQERYLNDTCKSHLSIYDTLPVMDGYNWSTADAFAGIRLVKIMEDGCSEPITGNDPTVSEVSDTDLLISWPLNNGGRIEILCQDDSMIIELAETGDYDNWALEMSWSSEKHSDLLCVTEKSLNYQHEGFCYEVKCPTGHLEQEETRCVRFVPENDCIVLDLGRNRST